MQAGRRAKDGAESAVSHGWLAQLQPLGCFGNTAGFRRLAEGAQLSVLVLAGVGSMIIHRSIINKVNTAVLQLFVVNSIAWPADYAARAVCCWLPNNSVKISSSLFEAA